MIWAFFEVTRLGHFLVIVSSGFYKINQSHSPADFRKFMNNQFHVRHVSKIRQKMREIYFDHERIFRLLDFGMIVSFSLFLNYASTSSKLVITQ